MHYTTALVISLLFLCQLPAHSQFYTGSQMAFGKNRVQYTDFQWTFYRYNMFDVYFYLNGEELATHTARYVLQYLPVMERKFETTLDQKMQFLVYNTMGDLKQSNLGLMGDEYYNTGGVTHIIGNKVFLYFDGDLNHFDRQIRSGISNLLLENMIHGSTITSQVKSSMVVNLPPWFSQGLVSYYGESWSTEMDNIVKDGILSGKYHKFNHLSGKDAVYAGHSIWYYIAEKYGEQNISQIINYARLGRNVESGFLYVLGLPFKKLVKDWEAWYKTRYTDPSSIAYTKYGNKINIRIKQDRVYSQVKLNPDGKSLVYVTNDGGLCKIYLYDMASGKAKKIFKRGYRMNDKVDYSYPLLSWNPTGQSLAMFMERKGILRLYFYAMDTRKWIEQNIFGFQKVVDFAYSPDGRSFVMSAVQRGESDIFLYNIAANAAEQITRDPYNDLNPRFLGRTNRVIFSSNRPTDTIRFNYPAKGAYDGMANNDLFIYDNNTKSKKLARVTSTPLADEVQPMAYANGYFTYLSDANGIFNRFIGKYDSSIAFVDTITHYRYFTATTPLTNYNRSVLQQDVTPSSKMTAELVFQDKQYNIYVNPEMEPGKSTVTAQAPTFFIDQKQKQYEAELAKQKEAATKPGKPVQRTAKRFMNIYEGDKTREKDTANLPGGVNALPGVANAPSGLRGKTWGGGTGSGSPDQFVVPKRLNYNVEYSINQLVSQLDFTYLNASYQPYTGYAGPLYLNPGTTALLTVGGTDLLENYRIIGGVRLNLDFRDNEYLLGFANLRKRIDHEFYFHRSSYTSASTTTEYRNRIHEFNYVIRYPFSEILALKGTSSIRWDRTIPQSYDQVSAALKPVNDYWGIIKGELIYDNTRELGKNLYDGMRSKLFGEYYQLLNDTKHNMIVVGLDIRKYIKIHRTFIWANRFAASTSFGTNRLLYYLGGVDNWLIPKFDANNSVAPGYNYAYQTLATDMRGFKQNIRNGNSFFVFSTELRFPVFQYLLNRPLRSEFLNNLQIVGFGDAGSAFKGLNPFSEENTFFTRYIQQPPFNITVQVQKNPIVEGFGFGARTMLFGYFVRADWAWGVEDGKVYSPLFYLSFSLDF